MNQILVDTSVWIDYFSGKKTVEKLDSLLDDKLVCTNMLIMCELLPFLHIKKENELIELLKAIPEIPLNIDWEKIIEIQYNVLKKNLKRVGIPDLIILDNAIKNDLKLYTLDNSLLQLKAIVKFNSL